MVNFLFCYGSLLLVGMQWVFLGNGQFLLKRFWKKKKNDTGFQLRSDTKLEKPVDKLKRKHKIFSKRRRSSRDRGCTHTNPKRSENFLSLSVFWRLNSLLGVIFYSERPGESKLVPLGICLDPQIWFYLAQIVSLRWEEQGLLFSRSFCQSFVGKLQDLRALSH